MQILGDGFVLKFTPHARGSTLVIALSAEVVYIYPACAGINPTTFHFHWVEVYLPRMRGDHPQPIVAYTTFKDLPRMRGDQPKLVDIACDGT